MGNKKQEELEKVRKEIDQLYMQEVQAEGPTQYRASKFELLEESLADTKYKIEEELFNKQSYMHMLERMKKDFIAAKISSSDHEKSLKNKAQVLDIEGQK